MSKSRTTYSLSFGQQKKKYGFFYLLVDLILTLMTGGLWLIWLLIKYLRNH